MIRSKRRSSGMVIALVLVCFLAACSKGSGGRDSTVDWGPDTDGDSMPDRWEIKYHLDPNLPDGHQDPDQDALVNAREFLYGTDPGNADTDGDRLPDGLEVCLDFDCETYDPYRPGTSEGKDADPTNPDTDGDGLKDGEELGYYEGDKLMGTETNPADEDTDDDGVNDGDEVKAGQDPHSNDAPRFHSIDPPVVEPGDKFVVHGSHLGPDPRSEVVVRIFGNSVKPESQSDAHTLFLTAPTAKRQAEAPPFEIVRKVKGLSYRSREPSENTRARYLFIVGSEEEQGRVRASREPEMTDCNAGDQGLIVFGFMEGSHDQETCKLKLDGPTSVKVTAESYDPITQAPLPEGGTPDLDLILLSRGWGPMAQLTKASQRNHNPSPLVKNLEAGTYFLRLQTQGERDSGYWRLTVEFIHAPYFQAIRLDRDHQPDLVEIEGLNFCGSLNCNQVFFLSGKNRTQLPVVKTDGRKLVVKVPADLGSRISGQTLLVVNQDTGLSSDDEEVREDNGKVTVSSLTGAETGGGGAYPGQVVLLDPYRRPLATREQWSSGANFRFNGKAGEEYNIIVFDRSPKTRAGDPVVRVIGPDFNEIKSSAGLQESHTWIKLELKGPDRLKQAGVYTIAIDPKSGLGIDWAAALEKVLPEDLQGLSFTCDNVKNDYGGLLFPGIPSEPIVLHLLLDGTTVRRPGVTFSFLSDDQVMTAETDENGEISIRVVSDYPDKLVQLIIVPAGAWSLRQEISFSTFKVAIKKPFSEEGPPIFKLKVWEWAERNWKHAPEVHRVEPARRVPVIQAQPQTAPREDPSSRPAPGVGGAGVGLPPR